MCQRRRDCISGEKAITRKHLKRHPGHWWDSYLTDSPHPELLWETARLAALTHCHFFYEMLKRRHCWPFSFTLYASVSVSLCERSLNERGRQFVRPTGLFLLGEFLSAALLLLWPCVPVRPREEPAWLRGHTHTHAFKHTEWEDGKGKKQTKRRKERRWGGSELARKGWRECDRRCGRDGEKRREDWAFSGARHC